MNTWLEVAEELEKRLLAKGKGLYYEEEEKLRKAFENAGREGRILSYEMKTAEKPYECHEVAKKLMAVGRLEEAEQMCKKGMNDQTWWRDSLMELLREIARMRKR